MMLMMSISMRIEEILIQDLENNIILVNALVLLERIA